MTKYSSTKNNFFNYGKYSITKNKPFSSSNINRTFTFFIKLLQKYLLEMASEGELSWSKIEPALGALKEVRRNPSILKGIKQAPTSCYEWGSVFDSLFVRRSICCISLKTDHFIRPALGNKGKPLDPKCCKQLVDKLTKSHAIYFGIKLPGGMDHYFFVLGDGQNARILHAWQDIHHPRVEKGIPIKRMVSLLRKLPTFDYSKLSDISKLNKVLSRLFGNEHMYHGSPITTEGGIRHRISYTQISSGKPRTNLDHFREGLKKLHSLGLGVSEPSQMSVSVRNAAGIGFVLGFVLGCLFTAINKKSDMLDVLHAGAKGAVAMGIAGAAGAAVAKKYPKSRLSRRIGTSLGRSSAVAGVVGFGVASTWDLVRYKTHQITKTEFRKSLAEESGAAGFGVLGGVGGALLGLLFGPFAPIAVPLLAVGGGVGAAYGGAKCGEKIDESIWNKEEDSVMDAYEFFGWYGVKRYERPEKSEQEFKEAYLRAWNKDKYNKEWTTSCEEKCAVLLHAMYTDEVRELQNIKEEFHKYIHDYTSGAAIYANALYINTSLENASIAAPSDDDFSDDSSSDTFSDDSSSSESLHDNGSLSSPKSSSADYNYLSYLLFTTLTIMVMAMPAILVAAFLTPTLVTFFVTSFFPLFIGFFVSLLKVLLYIFIFAMILTLISVLFYYLGKCPSTVFALACVAVSCILGAAFLTPMFVTLFVNFLFPISIIFLVHFLKVSVYVFVFMMILTPISLLFYKRTRSIAFSIAFITIMIISAVLGATFLTPIFISFFVSFFKQIIPLSSLFLVHFLKILFYIFTFVMLSTLFILLLYYLGKFLYSFIIGGYSTA